jgi:hypothetical protein
VILGILPTLKSKFRHTKNVKPIPHDLANRGQKETNQKKKEKK